MNSPRRAMTAANGYSPLWAADWAKVTQRRILIISGAAESRMLTALAQIGVVRSHFGAAKIFGGRSDRATMQNRTLGAHLVRRGWLGSDQFHYFVTMPRWCYRAGGRHWRNRKRQPAGSQTFVRISTSSSACPYLGITVYQSAIGCLALR